MRRCLIACLLLAVGPGCTSHYLRHSIVNQASTLTELQYQQVLGNLAMLSMDPWALPAHANLRDGSAQVQDVGLANLVAFTNGSQTLPGLTGSRTLVEQWGVLPVTEKVELQLLRVAYRRALGFGDRLDVELANDIAHELCDQLSNSDDINALDDPSAGREVLKSITAELSGHYLVQIKRLYEKIDDPQTSDEDAEAAAKLIKNLQGAYANDVNNVAVDLASAQARQRLISNQEDLINRFDMIGDLTPSKLGVENPNYNPSSPPGTLNLEPLLKKVATAVTHEARREIKELIKDIDEIPPGWFAVGRKKDIPPGACYVGHFRDRYAWVCPGPGTKELADFTAKVLDFSSLIKQRTVTTLPGGPRYTPEGNR